MTIGIIIACINVAIVLAAIIGRAIQWKRTRPKAYIRGVGIRYDAGAISPLPKLQCIVNGLYDRIGQRYGASYAESFLSGVIIEVVPADGVRVCGSTIVSQASRIAGSIDTEWWAPIPLFRKYWVAVVLQTPEFNTAASMAISHEIIKHILPITRGEGGNNDHSRQDLNQMSDGNDLACL